ncbi:hypothetical protein R2R32_08440 [Clostridium perfringens]|nr:hypothetical protein [Clostridium perfringens]
MYKAIGINMDKEYKALRKKSKRFVPPSHYRDNYSMNNSKEDNLEDYSFFDSMEDLKDCANSNDEDCKIRSCLLNKEIQVNKKVLIASCIGAADRYYRCNLCNEKNEFKIKQKSFSNCSFFNEIC